MDQATPSEGPDEATPANLILPLDPSTPCVAHQKPREIYCETHLALICFVCAYKDHPPPACKTVLAEEKAEEERKALLTIIPDVKTTLKDVQDSYDQAAAKEKEAEKKFEDEKQQVEVWRESTTCKLQDELERLTKQLQDNFDLRIYLANEEGDRRKEAIKTAWDDLLKSVKANTSSVRLVKEHLQEQVAASEKVSLDCSSNLLAVEEAREKLLRDAKQAGELSSASCRALALPVVEFTEDKSPFSDLGVAVTTARTDVCKDDDQDKRISLLKELRSTEQQLQKSCDQVKQKEKELAQLQADLASSQTEQKDFASKLSLKDEEIAALQEKVREHETVIRHLEDEGGKGAGAASFRETFKASARKETEKHKKASFKTKKGMKQSRSAKLREEDPSYYQCQFSVRPDLIGLAIGTDGSNIIAARQIKGVIAIELDEATCIFTILAENQEALEEAQSMLEFSEKIFHVPRCFISKVIGRKGNAIQDVVDKSGIIRVRIGDKEETCAPRGEDGKVPFILVGTPGSLNNAMLMLEYRLQHLEEFKGHGFERRRPRKT